jgi:hypothetical protein
MLLSLGCDKQIEGTEEINLFSDQAINHCPLQYTLEDAKWNSYLHFCLEKMQP